MFFSLLYLVMVHLAFMFRGRLHMVPAYSWLVLSVSLNTKLASEPNRTVCKKHNVEYTTRSCYTFLLFLIYSIVYATFNYYKWSSVLGFCYSIWIWSICCQPLCRGESAFWVGILSFHPSRLIEDVTFCSMFAWCKHSLFHCVFMPDSCHVCVSTSIYHSPYYLYQC